MLKKLRQRLEEIRAQKHKHFDDFRPLITKIAKTYDSLFPKFSENKKGSHYVYNFGVAELFPFTVVKEHGGRDCQSPKAAKAVIESIQDVLDFIEEKIPDDRLISEEETSNAGEHTDFEETIGLLPDPEIPDADC